MGKTGRTREVFPLIIIILCCFTILLIRLAQCQAADDGDNLTLFNPVYMLVNYGKMVYPAHGYFDSMVVHPPLHYTLIATVYKLTNNIVIARIFVYLLAYGVAFLVILKVQLKNSWKFAFLAALFWVMLSQFFYFGTRPSLCLSVYWFCGWILIEAGRQNNWKGSYLFFGSLLTGIASIMHYFAFFTGTGLLVYALLLIKNHDGYFAFRKWAYLLIPALTITIVYLILNIFPNLSDVRQAISNRPNMENIGDNMSQHLLYFSYLPPFLIAFALLFPSNKTRYVILAALPLPLFVFFFVYQKLDYFFPELLMMFFGLFLLGAVWLGNFFIWLITIFISYETVTFFQKSNRLNIVPYLKYSGMEVARACSKSILGNDARVGSRMDLWYISGASHWFNVWDDLYGKDSVNGGVDDYFRQFDIIAENSSLSSFTLNTSYETLPVWYTQGRLKLSSFFFRPTYFSDNALNMLFFISASKHTGLKGFSQDDNGNLFSYSESVRGDYMLVTFRTSKEKGKLFISERDKQNVGAFALPNPDAGHTLQNDNDAKDLLTFGIIPMNELNKFNFSDNSITIFDTIRILRTDVNIDSLMTEFRRTEKPISFYNTIESWNVNRNYYLIKH